MAKSQKTQYFIIFTSILFMFTVNLLVCARPTTETPIDQDYNQTNETVKELYVIREVIYEVGILVDTNQTETEDYDEQDSDTEEIEQRVQLTFAAKNHNGTIDLGDIPLPVQTNISGTILTGVAPVHVGEVDNLSSVLKAIPLTGTIVNISKTEGSTLTLDTQNITDLEQPGTFIDPSILGGLNLSPTILPTAD